MRSWFIFYLKTLAKKEKSSWFDILRRKKSLHGGEIDAILPRAIQKILQDKHGLSDQQLLNLIQVNQLGYLHGFFRPSQQEIRICIKRDPVERFVSGFSDKYNHRKFPQLQSVDQYIEDFPLLVEEPLHALDRNKNFNLDLPQWRNITLARHFSPQVDFLGKRPDFYTHVFDIKDTASLLKEFLEDEVYRVKLPAVQKNRKKNKISLTPAQQDSIAGLYKVDYDCGWH